MNLKFGRVFEISTVRGDPVEVGNRRLVPIARAFSMAISQPRRRNYAGFLLVRPLAVEVSDDTGSHRISIVDTTRFVIWGLLSLLGILAILTHLLGESVRHGSEIRSIRR